MAALPIAIGEIDDPDQIRPLLWQSGRFVHMPLRGYDPTFRFRPGSSASGNVRRLRALFETIDDAGGGTLVFAAGSYDFDSATLGAAGIALPANVRIEMYGAVLNVTGSTACNFFIANNVSDISVNGGEVHGNGVSTAQGNGEFIRFTNSVAASTMRNLHVRGTLLYNFAGAYWIAFVANAAGARVSGFSARPITATSESTTVLPFPTNVAGHAFVVCVNAVNGFCEDFVIDDITADCTYIKGSVLIIAAGAISSALTCVQDGIVSRIRGYGAGKNIATNNNGSYDVCFYGAVRRVELDDFVSRDAWDKGLYVASTLDCTFRNLKVTGQTGTYQPLLDAAISISATRATIDNVRASQNTINFLHNSSGKPWTDTSPYMDGEYAARRDTTLASWALSTAYIVGDRVLNDGVATTAWAPSTAYTAGQYVTNGGNTYSCDVNGTSAASGGPTGQNSGYPQADGTTSWHYLAPLTYECTVAGTSAAAGNGPNSVVASNILDGTVRWKAVPPNVYRATVSNTDKIGLTGTTGPLSSTTGLTDGDVTWVYVGTEIPIDTKISNLHCDDATVGPGVQLQASGAGKGVQISNFSSRTSVGKAFMVQATSATYTSHKISDGIIDCTSSSGYAVDYTEIGVNSSSPCGIDWDNVTVNYDGPTAAGVRLRDKYGDVNLNNVKINKDLASAASGSLLEFLGSDPSTGGNIATPSLTNIQLNGVRSGVTGLNGQAFCRPRQMTGINFSTAAGTLASANSPGLAVPTWSGQTGQRIQNLTVGAGEPSDWECVGTTNWLGSGYLPLTGSVTTDVASIAAGATATFTITVTGAAVGDEVISVTPSTALEAGLTMLPGAVSAANTVTVYIWNTTAGAVDPASRTYTANVRKP